METFLRAYVVNSFDEGDNEVERENDVHEVTTPIQYKPIVCPEYYLKRVFPLPVY